MVETARLYTPAEAAAVSGLALKAVNNVIHKHIVDVARPHPGARAPRRYLTHTNLLTLWLERYLAGSLTLDRRQTLYRELADQPDIQILTVDTIIHIDVKAANVEVDARVRALRDAEAVVHSDADILAGEPVFKGTRVPVYAVAAMLEAGAEADDILSGYPTLEPRMLDLAQLWAAAHPRRGRPRRLAEQGVSPSSTKRVTLKGDPLAKTGAAAGR